MSDEELVEKIRQLTKPDGTIGHPGDEERLEEPSIDDIPYELLTRKQKIQRAIKDYENSFSRDERIMRAINRFEKGLRQGKRLDEMLPTLGYLV